MLWSLANAPYPFAIIVLFLADKAARFEAHVLHVPRAVCFFTRGAPPEVHYNEFLMFSIALFDAVIMMPLFDRLTHGYKHRGRFETLLLYGRGFLVILSMFWFIIMMVSLRSAALKKWSYLHR